MKLINNRMQREVRTIEAMIRLYCKKHHGPKTTLCESCDALLEYAKFRLSKCPFQEAKSTCGKCRIHCYKPDMRERIQHIMRETGPHMAYRHPIMAVMHFFDKFRKAPDPKQFRADRARDKT